MKVPFTISDFLYRAENVYADRIALVDEPDMPGGGLGELTWRDFGVKVREQAAKLDELGIGTGERVAMVSQKPSKFTVGPDHSSASTVFETGASLRTVAISLNSIARLRSDANLEANEAPERTCMSHSSYRSGIKSIEP